MTDTQTHTHTDTRQKVGIHRGREARMVNSDTQTACYRSQFGYFDYGLLQLLYYTPIKVKQAVKRNVLIKIMKNGNSDCDRGHHQLSPSRPSYVTSSFISKEKKIV
jgi:hypothetical protein